MLRHTVSGLMLLALVGSVGLIGHSAAAGQSEDVTVGGCLQAGAKEGEFVLVVDDKITYQIQPAEGVELAPHANHRVELTGTVEKTETSSILKAKCSRWLPRHAKRDLRLIRVACWLPLP